jgi:hypothetical protein
MWQTNCWLNDGLAAESPKALQLVYKYGYSSRGRNQHYTKSAAEDVVPPFSVVYLILIAVFFAVIAKAIVAANRERKELMEINRKNELLRKSKAKKTKGRHKTGT